MSIWVRRWWALNNCMRPCAMLVSRSCRYWPGCEARGRGGGNNNISMTRTRTRSRITCSCCLGLVFFLCFVYLWHWFVCLYFDDMFSYIDFNYVSTFMTYCNDCLMFMWNMVSYFDLFVSNIDDSAKIQCWNRLASKFAIQAELCVKSHPSRFVLCVYYVFKTHNRSRSKCSAISGLWDASTVNCRGKRNSAAVNCREVLRYFICVFQPSFMCEQQFSIHIDMVFLQQQKI